MRTAKGKMQKYSGLLMYVGFFFALSLQLTTARADFNCQSEVSYKWKLVKPEKADKDQKDQKNSVPETPEPDQEVFYSSVSVTAADEAAAKSLLAPRILDNKAAALRKCQDEHQNVGRCFSIKLTGAAATLNSASFSARKLLEQAMMEDCQSVSGRCGDLLSTEVKCQEIIVAPVGSPAAEDPKAAKKDEKKKK